jgi:hypothetical protein
VADVPLPTTLTFFFGLLRQSISLVEQFVKVVSHHDLSNWRTLLFLYLVICLTVRMAPLTGNLRGSLGAIFLTGLIAFIAEQIMSATPGPVTQAWPLITFSVAVLLFLLMVSLLVKGAVCLVKTVHGPG